MNWLPLFHNKYVHFRNTDQAVKCKYTLGFVNSIWSTAEDAGVGPGGGGVRELMVWMEAGLMIDPYNI